MKTTKKGPKKATFVSSIEVNKALRELHERVAKQNNVFTRDDVIDFMTIERQRATAIAHSFRDQANLEYKSRENAGSTVAFVKRV